jgi:threonine/homoserine/homoserine lactone efflux protein
VLHDLGVPDPTTISLFALATAILTASPGPGVLYLVARTAHQGRRAGFASMAGIESGEVLWLVATASGVAAILSASQQVLGGLRFAGAAYLVYLGVQRWRGAGRVEPQGPDRLPRIYVQGIVTQLLNPKVAVFFLAFLPQYLTPSEPVLEQVAVLGAVYIGTAVVVDTTYVLSAHAVIGRLFRGAARRRRGDRFAAAAYVALGMAAAATGARRA